ncbi:AAA family ATPase [Actinotalea sp.]|uniref:AAA family ATPase n=1 Tax=Actinotalea sp. TaxID=1872145 RepID=UPI002C7AB594|nr:AAA family ATPase [Actinotalea sp.]HQY33424.1 AAA family ATPase [Actinotalea sp.]HRA49774.1 AAA family ATPase [Actinotalea sp.]
MVHALPTSLELDDLADTAEAIRASMESVISGRPDLVRLTVAVLLAEGHLLLEDVPGVGKTTLAKALARSVDCTVGRIQFTPDLLPSDLTGVTIYRPALHDFEFRPGPVFANVVIGDEINRASPKTQSALLECMQEAQTTIDGTTYHLPRPFLVLATQNPVEMEGTYALPEAQRDRFMARLSVGYPARDAEVEMLDRQEAADPLAHLVPVTGVDHLAGMIDVARRLYAAPAIKQYVVDLVAATRVDPLLRLGASPRAAIQLLRAAKAVAAMAGRSHVLPDDVQGLVVPVLAHRLLASPDARLSGRTIEETLTAVVKATALPPVSRTAPDRRATG